MSQKNNEKEPKGPKKFVYFIDQEKFETNEKELSVAFLIAQAEEDPATSTLALKDGRDVKKFTDLNEMVPMKNGMKFIIFHNTPTTVS
ncbi:MAG TPA: hypothetical protein PKE69_18080 [Pyrinomonadaceae bacterium]|nr:hypothetical protein [Pyrinomonadaceae bacterium]